MSNISYVGYDAKGRIVSQSYCAAEDFSMQEPADNEAGLLTLPEGYANAFDYYVVMATKELLPLSNLAPKLNKPVVVANGIDTLTISALPEGTEFTVAGSSIMPEHGEIRADGESYCSPPGTGKESW